MLWSDGEVRAALVKVYQDILEEQEQAIEDAKNRLSNYESPVGDLISAAADLNFYTKWRNAATNLIETLYFQLLGEEFGKVNVGEEKGAGHGDTAEGILKEVIDEYDAFKALIGPFMDDEGCYCDAKVSINDIYRFDATVDKARAFLDKQTESNDEEEED